MDLVNLPHIAAKEKRLSQLCLSSAVRMIYILDNVNLYVNTYCMREIFFYKTESGKCPVEDFLESLSSKQAQKVTWVLSLIEELPKIPNKYFKKLVGTDDLWEVRVNYSGEIFRLLGFFDGSQLIVLNCAFQKKTQKTPRTAIQVAQKRKQEYLNRRKAK